MSRKVQPILFFILSVVLILAGLSNGTCHADEALSAIEQSVLEKINVARLDPHGVGAAIGVDTTPISDLTAGSMNALIANTILQATATEHSLDMLARGYFSKTTPDGVGYEARILAGGYPAELTGETIGVVTFKNFIDPQLAAELLFRRLFLKDVSAETVEMRMLLNPRYEEVGVSIQAGKLTLGDATYNAYVATVDLALQPGLVPDTALIENGFIALLNEERQAASAAAAESPKAILRDEPLDRIAEEKLSGWALDASIGESLMPMTIDSEALADDEAGTSEVIACFGSIHALASLTAEDGILTSLFAELQPDSVDGGPFGALGESLYAVENDSIGMAMEAVSVVEGGVLAHYLRVVWIVGRTDAKIDHSIAGIVFKDLDADGRYDLGEETADLPVILYGAGLHLKTNEYGQFTAEVTPGSYLIVLFQIDGTLKIQEINHGQDNQWVSMPMAAAME